MLLRAIFWISLIVMFLPVQNDNPEFEDEKISDGQTIVLFQSFASDLSGFCDRNPISCGTARQLTLQYGSRFKAHAQYLVENLSENFGDYLAASDESDTNLITGAINPPQ